MTPWEEIRSLGAFGPEATLELYRCVRAVARASNFPPPAGHQSWSVDAVMETAHEVFADGHGPQRLVALAVKADSDRSFTRLLEQVARNYLRDQARATAKGRLIRRLRKLLESDPRFAFVSSGQPGERNVMLTDGSTAGVWGGRMSDLVAAAYKVTDVTVVRWRPQTRREPPVAEAVSLLAVCEAVLRAAEGTVRLPDLAEVVAARFAAGQAPVVTPVDDVEPWLPTPEPTEDASIVTDIATAAEMLVSQLTPRERLVLAHLDLSVRQLADITGLGKSTAAELASRVREIVGQVLGHEEHREAILAHARDLVSRRLPPQFTVS